MNECQLSDNHKAPRGKNMESRSAKRATRPDGKGSTYCSYNEKSSNYDSTRRPLGVGIILGYICMTEVPLSKIRLLDIGCGTGSFIAMVCWMLEHVTGLEVNDGMIAQSKAKLKGVLEAGKVNLVQAAAIDLPFDPNSFHAVTINVVIHHFPPENNFAYLKGVFKKIFHVLKPGGCFVLTHVLPHQNTDGYWWAPLMPKSTEYITSRCPPLELITRYLRDVGFAVDEGEIVTPLRGTFQNNYINKHGINGAFVPNYRDGDSAWARAESTGELEKCQAEIRKMQKDGTAKSWLDKREALRKLTGQATFFAARKPLSDERKE